MEEVKAVNGVGEGLDVSRDSSHAVSAALEADHGAVERLKELRASERACAPEDHIRMKILRNAQRKRLFEHRDAILSRLTASEARVKALEGALEPFAKVAHMIDSDWYVTADKSDGATYHTGVAWRGRTLTIGDFRRARAALTHEPPPQSGEG